MSSPSAFAYIMAVTMDSFIIFADATKSNTIEFLIVIINIIKSCSINMKLSGVKILIIATIVKIIVIIINIIKTCSITMKLSGIKFIIIIASSPLFRGRIFEYCMIQSPHLPMTTFPFSHS